MNDAADLPKDAAAGPGTDAEHPWLGLASFTEETQGYFYGREEEIAELARRVQRKLLTILFGQSGLGKTSILRAGIVPRLRPEGYCPVYVRIDYSQDAPEPSEQIKRAIFRATQSSGQWSQTGVAVSGESLWEFLHHRGDVLRDASGRILIPLLIFDQFEEIFTLAQSDDFGRKRAAQFIEDLADLVENRPPKALEAMMEQDEAAVEKFDFTRGDYRILIALREDYLANLEGVKGVMPSVTQNRMRLARMTGAQAVAAVVKPGGRLVSQEVAEAIVRFIAGGSELPNAEVEPSLLSLICRELNTARIAQGRSEISADLLAGTRDTILSEFYERALTDQPAGVRTFIEDTMLTESGFRESLAEERVLKGFAAAGAAPDSLAKLVDRRLLRIEERLDVRRVELTHDVLCGVVRASRDLRYEREARDEAERQLAAQRERERATRQALVRARKIATVCGVLAVLALGGLALSFVSTRRAQQAEAAAQQTRELAEAARGESEKLVVYLLDDFYRELAPIGGLNLVGDLAKRTIAYYDGLPEALRTPETNRNRALAQVRYALVLRNQGKMDEGRKTADDAVQVLGKLREQGDSSEITAIGLTQGLGVQARLASSERDESKALATAQRALEVIKPFATAPDASVAARRTYGEVLVGVGYQQLAVDQNDASIATEEQAKAALKSIDNLQMTDLTAAATYAEAVSWQVQAYLQLGRSDDALRAGAEGIAVADRVLEKRPGHMSALRGRGLITSPLAYALLDQMNSAEALTMSDKAIASWQEYLRVDPSNTISRSNLNVGYGAKVLALQELGRPGDAAATIRVTLAAGKDAARTTMIASGMALGAGRLAYIEADRGNAAGAKQALEITDEQEKYVVDHSPAGSFTRAMHAAFPEGWRQWAMPLMGQEREAIAEGAKFIQKMDQLKPGDESQRKVVSDLKRSAHVASAQAATFLKDYATAVSELTKAVELHKQVPIRQISDQREAAFEKAWLAVVLARDNRREEAQKLVPDVLKLERDFYARNKGSQQQRMELAVALFAAAISHVGDSQAQLNEASAIMEKLPPEMLRLKDVAFFRNAIVQEKALYRPS